MEKEEGRKEGWAGTHAARAARTGAPLLTPHAPNFPPPHRSKARLDGPPPGDAPEAAATFTFNSWLELLCILSATLAGGSSRSSGALGAGSVLGVPPPAHPAHGPWPPLDAFHAMINALYSRGARFGGESAALLRDSVTALRARVEADEEAPHRSLRATAHSRGASMSSRFSEADNAEDGEYWEEEDDREEEGDLQPSLGVRTMISRG